MPDRSQIHAPHPRRAERPQREVVLDRLRIEKAVFIRQVIGGQHDVGLFQDEAAARRLFFVAADEGLALKGAGSVIPALVGKVGSFYCVREFDV